MKTCDNFGIDNCYIVYHFLEGKIATDYQIIINYH